MYYLLVIYKRGGEKRMGKRKEEMEGGKVLHPIFFHSCISPCYQIHILFHLKKKRWVLEIKTFIAMACVPKASPAISGEGSHSDGSSRGMCCPGAVRTETMCRSEAPLAARTQGSLERARRGTLSSRSPFHLLRGLHCLCFPFSRGFFHIPPMPRDLHPPHR